MLGAKLASAQPEANGDILDEGDPTILDGTDFTGADLTRATFDGAIGTETIFVDTTLVDNTWGPGLAQTGGIIAYVYPKSCTGRILAAPGSKAPRLMASSSSAAILRG